MTCRAQGMRTRRQPTGARRGGGPCIGHAMQRLLAQRVNGAHSTNQSGDREQGCCNHDVANADDMMSMVYRRIRVAGVADGRRTVDRARAPRRQFARMRVAVGGRAIILAWHSRGTRAAVGMHGLAVGDGWQRLELCDVFDGVVFGRR